MKASQSLSAFLPMKHQQYAQVSMNQDEHDRQDPRARSSLQLPEYPSSHSGSGSYDVVDRIVRSESQHVLGTDEEDEEWEQTWEGEVETGNGLVVVSQTEKT